MRHGVDTTPIGFCKRVAAPSLDGVRSRLYFSLDTLAAQRRREQSQQHRARREGEGEAGGEKNKDKRIKTHTRRDLGRAVNPQARQYYPVFSVRPCGLALGWSKIGPQSLWLLLRFGPWYMVRFLVGIVDELFQAVLLLLVQRAKGRLSSGWNQTT